MPEVRVHIENKNRRVGAMVKALAVEISGFQTVKGTTKEFLAERGYYLFSFPTERKADAFRGAVRRYLPGILATPED